MKRKNKDRHLNSFSTEYLDLLLLHFRARNRKMYHDFAQPTEPVLRHLTSWV